MTGQIISHYRLMEELGRGGMGVVYKAHDMNLDRLVAVKVLPPERVADPERKKRFVQEAKAASALNHPNIVHMYGIDTAGGVDFIAMEYVDGKTLDKLMPVKGMRPAQALKYAIQMADALAKAHVAGIVHRDLKPSNVMVTEEGRVKVLDFGLAKLMEPVETSPEATTLTVRSLTEEGAVVGTVPYMSPEQAEGCKLDARSDIFSFGSVLYEMVTGRRPFTGGSRLSILSKIVHDDPTPPIRLAAAIPLELERIILRCMRKDPARRYQTMADLKVALEDVEQESGSGKQVRRARTWRRWAWAAVLPALLVVGLFSWRASRTPAGAEALHAVPLTSGPGVARYPSFSPDGNYVAFAWTGEKQNNPDIYVQQIGSGRPLRVTADPANDYNPVWAPDGRSLAFLRSQSESGKSELRLIPPLGGAEHKLADIFIRGGVWVTPPYLAWCPDSKCLVVTDSPGEGKPDALFAISLETGEKRQLTNSQPPVQADTSPAVSPDGRWLVYRRTTSLFNGELYLLPLRKDLIPAGEPQRLTASKLNANHPTWMPDSREILFSAYGGLRRLVVGGEKPGETLPSRLPFVGEDGLMPVVSRPQPGRPSRLVYVHSFSDTNIWRVATSALGAPATSPPAPFISISSSRGDWFPQFSPDGRHIAFSSDRTGESGIWLADADGSNLELLAPMGAFATGYPHWSPDGKQIVFHSNPEGQGEIYVIPAAGGKPRNLTSHPANDAFPSFSRDGQWIYFTSNRTGVMLIWKMPASGGTAVQVTKTESYDPTESPDAANLYYVETYAKPSPLWRLPLSGGVPVKVLDGVFFGNFVVIDRGIYYIDKPSGQQGIHYLDKFIGEARLQYFDLATRKSTTVARNLGDVGAFLTVSPDGRTLLYSREDSRIDDLMLVENFR